MKGAVLILETGFQAGDAMALEWGDIDEEKRTLKVTRCGWTGKISPNAQKEGSLAEAAGPLKFALQAYSA